MGPRLVAAVGDVALDRRVADAALPAAPRRTDPGDRTASTASRSAGDASGATTWRSIAASVATGVRRRAPRRAGRGLRVSSVRPGPASPSFSIRIAVALNSAVPDFGSVASIVSRFVGDVVLEVEGHEREARAQRRVDPDRHLDLAAPRHDPDALAVARARSARRPRARCRASRRGAAATCSRRSGRRCCRSRAGDRWSAGSGTRRRACRPADRARPARTAPAVPGHRVLPEPPVEEQLAGMRLVVARPLEPAVGLEPRVAHPGVDRRERSHLVPDGLGRRRAPVVAHRAGRGRR